MCSRNNGSRTIGFVTVAAIAIMMMVFSQPLRAAEATKEVSKKISDLRDAIISADVLLTSPNLETRGEVKEEDLPKYACAYRVTEKKDLDPLIDLLANAGILEVASADIFEMRVAVYLHTRDGETLGIATSPDYSASPATGTFNRTTPIKVTNGYEANLRAWAANRTSLKHSGRCRS